MEFRTTLSDKTISDKSDDFFFENDENFVGQKTGQNFRHLNKFLGKQISSFLGKNFRRTSFFVRQNFHHFRKKFVTFV